MKIATLSFDDGPPHDSEMVKFLKHFNIRATFYLMAAYYENGPAEGKPGLDVYDGMEIGCHAWSHSSVKKIDPELYEKNSTTARQALQKTFKQPVDCFAYPYGDWSKDFMPHLRFAGFKYARVYKCVDNVEQVESQWLMPVTTRISEQMEEFIHQLAKKNIAVHIAGHSWEMTDDTYRYLKNTINVLKREKYEFATNSLFFNKIGKLDNLNNPKVFA